MPQKDQLTSKFSSSQKVNGILNLFALELEIIPNSPKINKLLMGRSLSKLTNYKPIE